MLVALLLPVLLGLVGLVVDTGHYFAERRQTQNAADQAATAAAHELLYGSSIDSARAAALENAAANGFDNDGTTNTVTVNIPPSSGEHVGDSDYVEAFVEEDPTTFFIHVLLSAGTVRGRGVAGFVPTPKNYALLVLNPTMCSAYDHTSSSSLTIVGGGAMIDSSCQPSASQGGGSLVTASFLDYYAPGSWELSNNASTSVPPSPFGARIADPLASLTRPVPCAQNGTPAGCIARSTDSTGTANNPRLTHIVSNSPVTLHPGTYYGGLKFSGSGSITLEPGLYVLAGGGLDYSGTASITGNGVTIFNTYDPYQSNGAGACDSIALQGNGTLLLTAPTSGAYEDMLFWQDPACTNAFKYAGSSYTTSGIIYLPTAQLNVSGGGNLGALQIIVDSFSYSGSASVTITYGDYIQITAPRVALVE
jgi:hypothetical protein